LMSHPSNFTEIEIGRIVIGGLNIEWLKLS